MLRHEVGDEAFFKGMRLYYEKFKNSNALTSDFKKVMEQVSGRNLESFFRQWLYVAGQPELKIWNETGKRNNEILICIEQKQESLFKFDLELLIKDNSGEKIIKVPVNDRITKIPVKAQIDAIITPDPNVNLLFKIN
jgi:aminopeptidase N